MANYTYRDDHVPGYVYLLEAKDSDGLYKIGLTRSPSRRLEQLNGKQSPYHLDYVKVIEVDDMATVERRLHQQFKRYATKKNEWFKFDFDSLHEVLREMGNLDSVPQRPTVYTSPSKDWSTHFDNDLITYAIAIIIVISGSVGVAHLISSFRSHPTVSTCTVTAPSLNVRFGPGQEHPISAAPLAKGAVVEKLEESSGWVHIRQGWVAGNQTHCKQE